MTSKNIYFKDKDATLDWKFQWKALTNGSTEPDASDWLETTETILSYEITNDSGIVVSASSLTDTNTSVTVWLSGGTINTTYSIACRITTTSGRIDERTIYIIVTDR